MNVDEIPSIDIAGQTIRLGQFLKLAGLAESGSEARELIQGGDVQVDGVIEHRRGRQLTSGALVSVLRPNAVVAARVR